MSRVVTAEDARLLFIIDNDFGELTMASLFVIGNLWASRTTFLLPPRLFAINHDSLPVRTLPSSSYKDLYREIDDNKPDVVFLFSGYLLPAHQLVSLPILADLVRHVRSLKCAVVTSDPFWGLLADEDSVLQAGPKQQ